MTRRSALMALVVLAFVAACGGDDDAPSTTTVPSRPAGLDGTLVQYREDEVLGIVQAQLHNGTTDPVRVTEIAIRWDGFEPLDPQPVDHLVSPGITLDVPVDFGAARCADPPGPDDAPPSGVVSAFGTVVRGDGSPEPLRVTLADDHRIAPKLFRIGCERQAVEWAAPITFAAGWTDSTLDGFPAVRTEVVIERNHADGPVMILAVDGSVLLGVRRQSDASPLATLAAGEERAAVEVTVVSTGLCTGHALGDSKKTFIFHVGVDLGESEPFGYEVRPGPDLQAAMQRVIDVRCAAENRASEDG